MATTVLANACIAGVIGGLLVNRFNGGSQEANYAAVAAQSVAIRNEFLALNAALPVPLDDATNTSLPSLLSGVAFGTVANQGTAGVNPADNVIVARQILAATQAGLTSFNAP